MCSQSGNSLGTVAFPPVRPLDFGDRRAQGVATNWCRPPRELDMPRTRGRAAIAAALVAMAGPLLAVPAVAVTANHHPRQDDGRVVSAYFADWDVYGRGYNVKDIPADKLNVIQYAFGAPTFDKATGAVGCSILDPWADYQRPIDASLAVDGIG